MAGLITKYRPATYKEVLGQDDAVATIKGLEKEKPQGVLLVGPTGVGKTTLYRIFASRLLKIKPVDLRFNPDYTEINVGSEKGIDHVRNLIEKAKYAPFGEYKVIVLDEIHTQTPQALSALLKPLEDEVPNVIWILVTNKPDILPREMLNRVSIVTLSYVNVNIIKTMLVTVAKAENLKLPKEVIQRLAENSDETPRNALSLFSSLQAKLVGGAKTVDPKSIAKLAKQIIANQPNPEDMAMNLLAFFWMKDKESFIAKLCTLDTESTNHVVRLMSYINEYFIFKKCDVKKKFWCKDWGRLNKLGQIMQSRKNALELATELQLKLVPLINQYPLPPLQLYSLWK